MQEEKKAVEQKHFLYILFALDQKAHPMDLARVERIRQLIVRLCTALRKESEK